MYHPSRNTRESEAIPLLQMANVRERLCSDQWQRFLTKQKKTTRFFNTTPFKATLDKINHPTLIDLIKQHRSTSWKEKDATDRMLVQYHQNHKSLSVSSWIDQIIEHIDDDDESLQRLAQFKTHLSTRMQIHKKIRQLFDQFNTHENIEPKNTATLIDRYQEIKTLCSDLQSLCPQLEKEHIEETIFQRFVDDYAQFLTNAIDLSKEINRYYTQEIRNSIIEFGQIPSYMHKNKHTGIDAHHRQSIATLKNQIFGAISILRVFHEEYDHESFNQLIENLKSKLIEQAHGSSLFIDQLYNQVTQDTPIDYAASAHISMVLRHLAQWVLFMNDISSKSDDTIGACLCGWQTEIQSLPSEDYYSIVQHVASDNANIDKLQNYLYTIKDPDIKVNLSAWLGIVLDQQPTEPSQPEPRSLDDPSNLAAGVGSYSF